MEDLYRGMEASSLAPLWDMYKNLVTREPARSEPSRLWRWAEVLPTVERAAETVKGELADHRVLLLRNPAFQPRMLTTTNLIAGFQCVMPGEKTVEHRHSASACRLILEGDGGATFVDGKRCPMFDGDFIITPNWTWHGHHNDSGRRTVWLDMLDVPLCGALDANFAGQGPANAYPEWISTAPDEAFAGGGLVPMSSRPAVPYSPRFRYPWREMVAALAEAPPERDGSRRVRYANPLDGGPLMATLDAWAVEIGRGRETAPARTTANALCVVVEGEGTSRVGEATHKWSKRDVFTLPHWQWTTHRSEAAASRLLVVTDREVLRRLGLLREETQ
jgi:gentisate 1,2-dioxygenase